MKAIRVLIFSLFFSVTHFAYCKVKPIVIPGAYQTEMYFPLLKGKTIGIVANQTSMIAERHLVDSLKLAGFKIKCVFAPEHGFRGEKGAGEEIGNGVDPQSGIKVISIYGSKSKPDSEDLEGIDIILFDIQDVGVRFYTYISTLQYMMESCAEKKIPLIVLDRPNPNGFYIDGPVLEKKYSSFVGMQPVPVVYGMTIGEYAKMLNGEKWLRKKVKCNLKVIPIRNYDHSSRYELPIAPSPNLPDMDAVYLYSSICFFEGTNVSLGRGTNKPFRFVGFPENNNGNFSFTPNSIEGVAKNPPFKDTICNGIDLSGEGIKINRNPGIELKWLLAMYADYPKKEFFFNTFFDKLAGTAILREQIQSKKTAEEIKNSWKPAIKKFKLIRKKYLLYVDFE